MKKGNKIQLWKKLGCYIILWKYKNFKVPHFELHIIFSVGTLLRCFHGNFHYFCEKKAILWSHSVEKRNLLPCNFFPSNQFILKFLCKTLIWLNFCEKTGAVKFPNFHSVDQRICFSVPILFEWRSRKKSINQRE